MLEAYLGKNPGKTTLWEPNRCFTLAPQGAPPPPPTFLVDPSKVPKAVINSHGWGLLAPMGKLVMCLDRVDRQKRTKGRRSVRF